MNKNTATEPCPFPLYDVYVHNFNCVYVSVWSSYKHDYEHWIVTHNSIKRTDKIYSGRKTDYWHDFVSLKICNNVYFKLLYPYYGKSADIVNLDHYRWPN